MKKETTCIHLVGLEGSGHHGVYPLIESFIRELSDQDFCGRYPLQHVLDDFFCRKNINENTFLERIENFFLQNEEKVIFFDNSYPSQTFRGVNFQYDLVFINKIFSKYSKVKFIHLQRNLLNCILSRKDIDKGLIKHAQVIGPINRYVNDQLSILKEHQSPILNINYESINIENLINFIGINERNLTESKKIFSKIFRKSTRDYKKELNESEINSILEIINHK